MKYLIAHDLGTSGNKATLFSTEGQLIKSVVKSYDLKVRNANWAEQDPADYWQAVCESSKELLADVNPEDLAAVSFSGQMMGCICVDKEGKPLRDAIIWADMRSTEEEKIIREKMGDWRFYTLTGHRLSPSYGGQKFMWVRRNEPEIYQQTYKMLNCKDYIILKLTGQFVTEYTDASSTNLLDLNKLEWSQELVDVMGLDMDKLPTLLKSTDIAGTVTKEAAAQSGLPEGLPVVCGGGDGVCAAVGTGCIDEGIAHSCMGTSSWIEITSKDPILDKEMRIINWAHIVPGMVLPGGTMQTGGGSYSWLKKTLSGVAEQLATVDEPEQIYQKLNSMVADSPAGANGLVFLPYLIGERSPRWNPKAKGAFIGLDLNTNEDDLVRAVLEGVAYNMNVIMSVFQENTEHGINDMVVIGGGAQSDIWLQILADVYGIPIEKPNYLEEATSMGAAITAGVGVGIFKDFNVIDKFIAINEVKTPNPDNRAIYDRMQKIFDNCYFALEKTFDEFAE